VSESVKEINVGLLAYGAIGDEHSRAISAVKGLRLAAVADTNPDRLSAAKSTSHNSHPYPHHESLKSV